MNDKKIESLLHDINAVFDSVSYELCSVDKHWIEIHLLGGVEITANDFPHLLTIARNYNVRINIFVVCLGELGLFFSDMERDEDKRRFQQNEG